MATSEMAETSGWLPLDTRAATVRAAQKRGLKLEDEWAASGLGAKIVTTNPQIAKASVTKPQADPLSKLPIDTRLATLRTAMKRGHAAVVLELVKAGAPVDGAGEDGTTPIKVAAMAGQMAAVQGLLRWGARVDLNAYEDILAKFAPPRRRPQEGHVSQTFDPIDISPFVQPDLFDDAARKASAQAWDNMFRTVGFATISGHGVTNEIIHGLKMSAKKFFGRGSAYKQQFFRGLQMAGKPGYSPIGMAQEHSDPVEGYTFIRSRSEAWSAADETHPIELACTGRQYAYELERVMHAIHWMSAVALDLPANYFDEFYERPASVLVLSHYPPLSSVGMPDCKLRYRAHSDYSGFTILLQDDEDGGNGGVGGLEIDINGAWVPVTPQPGCFVVNIGDLFETWTNDRWRSTPHRVRSPAPGTASAEQSRNTAMLFSGPSLDAVIAPIATCVDKDHPSRYAPIKAAEHLKAQYITKSKEAEYRVG